MESGLTKNQLIAQLTKSPHGDLAQYAEIGLPAAVADPNFFAHLIAWNGAKGAIRDAKVALPVLALTAPALREDAELRDNALAHIAKLSPRDMVRAVRFAKGQPVAERRRLTRVIEAYLRDRESSYGRFERVALQHKGALKELYALLHIKPGDFAQKILFDGLKLGVFADVARLKDMDPVEAAGTIMAKRIPFLVAMGALGAKSKDPAVVQALIGAMTPTELVTNSKMLERLGVKTDPALRAAYEAGLQKVGDSNAATLKTTRAAEAIGGATGERLRGAQEKQLDKLGVQGDWLVLADKSSSMRTSIGVARQICDVLARVAQGAVHLVFYDDKPTYFNVTGKTLDEIAEITKRVVANGNTGIGCGLDYAQTKGFVVDGVIVIGDANENQPPSFASAYAAYCKWADKQLPVYVYQVAGDPPNMLDHARAAGIDLSLFDMRGGFDFYSLPNLVATMRTNKYSLVDEINETPLLKMSDVFRSTPAPEAVTA